MFLLLVPRNFEPIKTTSSQIIAYHSQLSHGKVPDHIHGTSTGFFPHRTNQAAKALRFGGLKKNSRTSTRRFSIFSLENSVGRGEKGDDRCLQTVFCLEVFFLLGFLKYQASWGICKVEGVMVLKILDVIKGCWYHWWNKIALLQTQEKEFPFSCFQDQNTSDSWAHIYTNLNIHIIIRIHN